MGKFEKGHNLATGRPKGAQNKTTTELKALIAEICYKGLTRLTAEVDDMDTKELIDFVSKVLPYVMPKLQNTNLTTNEDIDAITISFKKKDE